MDFTGTRIIYIFSFRNPGKSLLYDNGIAQMNMNFLFTDWQDEHPTSSCRTCKPSRLAEPFGFTSYRKIRWIPSIIRLKARPCQIKLMLFLFKPRIGSATTFLGILKFWNIVLLDRAGHHYKIQNLNTIFNILLTAKVFI